MTKALIYDELYCINTLLTNNGIGKDTIPEDIVQGGSKVECKHLKILFGSYAKLNLGATNTTRERTIGVIVLQKSNGQLKIFYVLSIGRQINEYQLTEIPIYNYAIDCVEEIS